MSTRPASAAALCLFTAILSAPPSAAGQASSRPTVGAQVPARYREGDTLAFTFRYRVPASVGSARIQVLLLSGNDTVGRIRRVRPPVAQGSGQASVQHVFTGPVAADRIRVALVGSAGFRLDMDVPIDVTAVRTQLARPGFVNPGGGFGPPGEPQPHLEVVGDSTAPGIPPRVLSTVIGKADIAAPMSASIRWDTLSAGEAARVSPQSLQILGAHLARNRARVEGRDTGTSAMRRLRGLAVRPGNPRVAPEPAPPPEPAPVPPAAQDTLPPPGPWTIDPDGSLRRTLPDGAVEKINPQGQHMVCRPKPGTDEMLCMMALAIQIPRVIPGSEVATIDAAWLSSLDSWLETLADAALSEMRGLVQDEQSIQNYLALEKDDTLYQRLNRRLTVLGELIG